MKALLTILLAFLWNSAREADIPEYKAENKIIRTNFHIAFERIHSFEGYYANAKHDKGGETYRGISRRFNKNWIGWSRIDEFKKKNQPLKWNQQIPPADLWTIDYYVSLWVKEGFDNVKDSTLAAYVFEFRIHGVRAVKIIKEEINYEIPILITSSFENDEISLLNKVNKEKFLKNLKKRRIQYYKGIVKRDSTQKGFLSHWLKRTKL